MHQKSGVIAPYTCICHSCFQCFKYFFLCHMKYTQVCKAGDKTVTATTTRIRQSMTRESCFTLPMDWGKNAQALNHWPSNTLLFLQWNIQSSLTKWNNKDYNQLHIMSGWVLPPNQSVVKLEKSFRFQSLLDLQIMNKGVGCTYLNKKALPRLILKYFSRRVV